MLFVALIERIFDWFGDVALFWSKADSERVQLLQRARSKSLDCHDDTLIDSSKTHLLLCTGQEIHLVSRRRQWRAQLSEQDIELYKKRGRRAFRRIERRHRR